MTDSAAPGNAAASGNPAGSGRLAAWIAWRHLRSGSAPRWSGPLALVAGVVTALGAVALVASAVLEGGPPTEGLSTADSLGLLGILVLGVGLLLLSFAALLRNFTLLVGITVFSVAQGCAALIVVLSLLGGLEADLQRRLLGHRAHLRISPPAGDEIVHADPLVARLRELPEVAGVSPTLEGPVMVRSGFGRVGVILSGIDPALHAEATGLPDEVIEGDYRMFADPALLPHRPFPGIEPPEPAPEPADEPAQPDLPTLADETGPAGQPAEADDGGWEDPEREIPKLRAEGKVPPAVSPIAAPPAAEAEEEGDGWEDPEREIPRLRAEGKIPPAKPPVGAEPASEPELEDNQADAGSIPAPPSEVESSEPPAIVPVLLGVELASELSVGVGDPVQLITPEGRLTPAGLVPGVLAARVAGVYMTGVYEDDHEFVHVPLRDAQAFLRAPDAITAIAVRLRVPDDLAAGKAAVLAVAGAPLEVEDWRQIHRSLFSAMFLEKVAMFVALLFVILVAAFGILATNLMNVMERAPEIAIMKAIGARDRLIARVYALEGCIVGALGCVGGVAAGLGLAAWFGERGVPLPSSAFTLEALPLRTDPWEVALVAAAALVLVGLASVLPARAAAAVRPVDGLRRID
jgi:lipoprotein-releasing system permease protein